MNTNVKVIRATEKENVCIAIRFFSKRKSDICDTIKELTKGKIRIDFELSAFGEEFYLMKIVKNGVIEYIHIHAGDWIVVSSDLSIRVVGHTVFCHDYEIMGEEQ